MNEDRIVDILLIGGYLTIILLRLFNVINWSWWWILCPFWITIDLAIIGLIVGLIVCACYKIFLFLRRIKK